MPPRQSRAAARPHAGSATPIRRPPAPAKQPVRVEQLLRGYRRVSEDQIDSKRNGLSPDVSITGLEAPDRDDIHRDTEESAQSALEFHHVEQGTAFMESDQKIEVARLCVLAAGRRSEHCHARALVRTHKCFDLFPIRAGQFKNCSHQRNDNGLRLRLSGRFGLISPPPHHQRGRRIRGQSASRRVAQ